MTSLLASNITWMSLTVSNTSVCPDDCLGRGSCSKGMCSCEVQYSGTSCQFVNLPYVVSFGCIFHVISAVSFLQLILSMVSDYRQSTKSKLKTALRMTTSKCLYFFMALATLSKGLYFSLMEHIPSQWTLNLQSAYYPFLLASLGLLVCFWAEIYTKGIKPSSSLFLLHSHIAYSVFCVVIYTLLGAKWIVTEFVDDAVKDRVNTSIDGIWAGLMLVVFVLFLVYGVELFFKIRGAFATDTSHLNNHQVHCSRFGLVSQATFQLSVALLLICDVSSSYWKDSSSMLERTVYDIVFHIMELGVALWFPCALWNWKRPDKLWILNPRQLLQFSEDSESDERTPLLKSSESQSSYKSVDDVSSVSENSSNDCWICLEREATDDGVLMVPVNCECCCPVHHSCLKKWLMEKQASSFSDGEPHCSMCRQKYVISVPPSSGWLLAGLTVKQWVCMSVHVAAICGLVVAVELTVDSEMADLLKVLLVGVAIITGIVCVRSLVYKLRNAISQAKAAAMVIQGRVISIEAKSI